MSSDAGAPAGTAAPSSTSLARSTAMMTVLTLVSRATGLVRIVLVGAVVGTTFLGNTYQSTNTIPNVVFELMAAGLPAIGCVGEPGPQDIAEAGPGLALVAPGDIEDLARSMLAGVLDELART